MNPDEALPRTKENFVGKESDDHDDDHHGHHSHSLTLSETSPSACVRTRGDANHFDTRSITSRSGGDERRSLIPEIEVSIFKKAAEHRW